MKNYLSLIKFSHTVFALPFALVGFFLANYLEGKTPSLIVLSFILATWFINPLCFALSPVALSVVLGYSYTKRFTALCHFVLGLGLSLAPIGAFLAVTGHFDSLPLMFSLVVLLWVSGFDIIYALQDEEFDKSLNLNSIPVLIGRRRALGLSNILHLFCAFVMIAAVWRVNTEGDTFGYIHIFGAIVFIGLLIYQHTLVKENDLSKVNLAFFTTNGIASVIYGTFFILDFFF